MKWKWSMKLNVWNQTCHLLMSWTYHIFLLISLSVFEGFITLAPTPETLTSSLTLSSPLSVINVLFLFYFLVSYLFIFRDRRRKGERKGEEHHCVLASHAPPSGDLAHNTSMCPDWELNWWPFASQFGAQPTEPH